MTTNNFTSVLYIGLDRGAGPPWGSVATVLSGQYDECHYNESVKLPNVMYIIVASNWHKCSTSNNFFIPHRSVAPTESNIIIVMKYLFISHNHNDKFI